MKDTKEIIDNKTEEDIFPVYLRRKEAQKYQKMRMCKFYGHHLECEKEKGNRKCDFLHNKSIRAAHDIMVLNNTDG